MLFYYKESHKMKISQKGNQVNNLHLQNRGKTVQCKFFCLPGVGGKVETELILKWLILPKPEKRSQKTQSPLLKNLTRES